MCSARPARVLAEFDVDFPHPRTPATRQLRQFFDLKWQIFNLLREEAYAQALERAYARRRN